MKKQTKGLAFKGINQFMQDKNDMLTLCFDRKAIFEFQALNIEDCFVIYHCQQYEGYTIEVVGYFGVINEIEEKEMHIERLLTFDDLFDIGFSVCSITIYCQDDGTNLNVYSKKIAF